MRRTISVVGGILAFLTLLSSGARGQIIGPGSTLEGDYLRGVGIAAQGMGIGYYYTAMGDSINTDTFIRWSEWVDAVVKKGARELAARKAQERAKHAAEYNAIQKRLSENPESLDVQKGDALNVVLEQLMNPKISESSFRYAQVPLTVDVVRRIPFKLGEKNEKFSMSRLLLKGKGNWTVAFQDGRFAAVRHAYERVLDNALEQAIEGKVQIPAIEAVDAAVDDLARKLDEVVGPSRDRLYIEAKGRLEDLKNVVRLFKTHKVQLALGEMDNYSGTTVNDLRLFMQRHKLQFAQAESPDERSLYPELHAALVLQREKVMAALQAPSK
jgi:hypothetical protein